MTATTANVTLSSRVTVPDDVLFQELNGEAVILDLASERYFGLDAVGTRFWELVSHDPGMQVAFEQLLREYDVDAAQLESDLLALARDLLDAGLIRIE
ncbi:PqqD family protein [Thermomonas sp. HDW16]|uniref:PqqD family protein n=1 Tax=Thermomonas sp. HDW16 TaxID=2714945 RepID=UPI00140926A9|nr:PqqD family protein [Thermomonas sp. HDW16]QIL20533.1 PqqD family protein [Thermomonas sp. HDW16]